jgi:uncharacterized membrane protein YheB (UPF0754 family)
MAKKLTTEERLQKLAEETKKLQAKLREKRKKDTDELHRLLGKALVRYFITKGEGEIDNDLITFTLKNLNEKEGKKAERLVKSKPFKMKP